MERSTQRKEGNPAEDGRARFEPRKLFEASGVVALDKPAGLPTQAPPGIASVEAWLRGHLARPQPSQSPYVGVPHRLDRPVSGVLLMATTPRAARKLSRQFERRQVAKTYLAILAPADPEASSLFDAGGSVEWRNQIEKVPDEPRAQIVAEPGPMAREAVTHARLLGRLSAGRIMVELRPLTGRMHQLRLQAVSRDLPVVGDELYGTAGQIAFGPPCEDPRARPIALHAWRIVYADPDTGREVVAEAPLPEFWPDEARRAIADEAAGRGG